MRVRITRDVSGHAFTVGEITEVSDELAVILVESGRAEAAPPKRSRKPEAAILEPREAAIHQTRP